MIKYDSSDLYPLREKQIYINNELYLDRAKRGKSWFILDLALFLDKFIPKNSTQLITSDGKIFGSGSSRRGTSWYNNN